MVLESADEDPMDQLRGHSITYRIAVGPQQGRKVFTLQTLPDERDAYDAPATAAGNVAGFSLHAGVSAKAKQRDKLERLCRYITRPAISEKRLSLTNQGKVRYELKTPYRDGTTHVIFEPVDFIAKLAALVPKPRVNLTRFQGVRPEQQTPSMGDASQAGQGHPVPIETVKLLHYAGPEKPWKTQMHPCGHYYHEYARKVPFQPGEHASGLFG